MKANKKTTRKDKESQAYLPDPPVQVVDLPRTLPIITQREIINLADAHQRFQLAKADFERRRAAVTLKVLQLCRTEDGSADVNLSNDGSLLYTESMCTGSPVTRKLV